MLLNELYKMLDIPEAVQANLAECETKIDFQAVKQDLEQIKIPNPFGWEGALKHLKELLGPDDDGMKILYCQLLCVCDVYGKYIQNGISDQIFIDTMKFFTRFLRDHMDRHGSYRYVWAWWVPRQISMVEFRIGELEYEMRWEDKKPLIDIHIPADTDMTTSKLRRSYLDAITFIKKYYPDFSGADFVCSSWLLAPSLKKVLSENSKILQFQDSFIIGKSDEESLGFMDWVYGSREIPIDDLPENTSLQRNLKPYLQNGGKIEWTAGKLITDPFL